MLGTAEVIQLERISRSEMIEGITDRDEVGNGKIEILCDKGCFVR
jgi:hypothetical protein